MLSPRNSRRSLKGTLPLCSIAKDLCVSASSKRAVFLNLTPKIFSSFAVHAGLGGIFLDDQDGVVSAKSQGIRERHRNLHRARLVRDVIEIAIRVRGFVID